jgi:hypothetical protein
MARPSKYDRKYIKEVDKYLETRKDTVFKFVKTDGNKTTGYERLIDVKLPTIEGFALYLDITKKTLYNWRDKHPKFLHSLEKITKEQQKRLLDKGLSGQYNPTIAKLILSSNHGMRERSDVTSDDKPMPQPLLSALKEDNKDAISNHHSNKEDSSTK